MYPLWHRTGTSNLFPLKNDFFDFLGFWAHSLIIFDFNSILSASRYHHMSSFGGRLKVTTNTRFGSGANKVNARKSKAGGPKKLIIQGFKKKPSLPSNFEDESWFKLQKAVRAIHAKQPVQVSREELYRTTEDLCIHKMGARLYIRLQVEFEEYTERIVGRLLTSLESGSTASTLAFLTQTEAAWEDYCRQTLAVRSIFLYLDRTHVLQSAGSLKSIWSLAMHLLRVCLSRKPKVGQKLVEGMLRLIKGEREGEAINRSLIRSLVRMYSTLGIYDTQFETPLLEESVQFYTDEGVRLMDQVSILMCLVSSCFFLLFLLLCTCSPTLFSSFLLFSYSHTYLLSLPPPPSLSLSLSPHPPPLSLSSLFPTISNICVIVMIKKWKEFHII